MVLVVTTGHQIYRLIEKLIEKLVSTIKHMKIKQGNKQCF